MVGYDIDGVLAGFIEALFIKFGRGEEIKNRSLLIDDWNDPWTHEQYKKIINDYDFWLGIPKLNEPESLTVEPDVYVTARPIPTEVTREWLSKNGFPNKDIITVGSYSSKLPIIDHLGITAFIDDKAETIQELHEGGYNVVYYQPWYKSPKFQFHQHITDIRDYENFIHKKE